LIFVTVLGTFLKTEEELQDHMLALSKVMVILVVASLQTATPLEIYLAKMLVELLVLAQQRFLWDIAQFQTVSAQVL
jgi:hypothetical protein